MNKYKFHLANDGLESAHVPTPVMNRHHHGLHLSLHRPTLFPPKNIIKNKTVLILLINMSECAFFNRSCKPVAASELTVYTTIPSTKATPVARAIGKTDTQLLWHILKQSFPIYRCWKQPSLGTRLYTDRTSHTISFSFSTHKHRHKQPPFNSYSERVLGSTGGHWHWKIKMYSLTT